MSYYDLDAILADAQKVPSTFELDIPTLGHLTTNPTHPLKKGTTIPLPLWLSTLLAVSSPTPTMPLFTFALPASLSPRVVAALRADPLSIDLRALSPYFYTVGCRVLDLFEEEEIAEVLLETWRLRCGEIGDFAGNSGGGEKGGGGAEFMRGMDEAERGLFKVAHEGSKATKAWTGDSKK